MERAMVRRAGAGFALVTVMVAVLVCALTLTALVSRFLEQSGRARRALNTQAAAYLAEGGLVHGMSLYPTQLASLTGSPELLGDLATGGYHVVCVFEAATGSLGQVVAHAVAEGSSDDGGSAGCVVTFEYYPPPTGATTGAVVPLSYHRFYRDLDLGDRSAVSGLAVGDLAIQRRARLERRADNLGRELALTEAQYRAALAALEPAVPFSALADDWSEVVTAAASFKVTTGP